MNSHSFCSTTIPKTSHHSQTGIDDETAAKFGFSLTRSSGGRDDDKYHIRRGSFVVVCDTLEQAQSWLKGYECAIVSTSEYAE